MIVFQEIGVGVATRAGVFVSAGEAAVEVVVAAVAFVSLQVGNFSSAGGALVLG